MYTEAVLVKSFYVSMHGINNNVREILKKKSVNETFLHNSPSSSKTSICCTPTHTHTRAYAYTKERCVYKDVLYP